ncbi:MAG: hypothetical protein A3F12_02490 [Gammaproteobacteria bacterium RIFCSPHIGHO2_12_FULL_38_14]|nr:MAG: hypothetical protein A3F12_02490 [Gammaproteobacteria bacterium RIFCSPHIGHO2_12_FULL_38_14]
MVFYFFATVAIVSAIAVITLRNPVQSVLSLVVTFFSTACIWMTLHAEFLGLILVLVYVGAVMTLFLFVVMMLNPVQETKKGGFVRYLPFAIIAVLVMISVLLVVSKIPYFATVDAKGMTGNNTQALGLLLYTKYVFPFEIAGVLLLAAMVAAIALTHRKPRHRKVQDPAHQVSVSPKDRVRLLNLSPDSQTIVPVTSLQAKPTDSKGSS